MADTSVQGPVSAAADAAIDTAPQAQEEGDIVLCDKTVEEPVEEENILTDDYAGDFRYPLDLPLNKQGVSYVTFEAQYVEGANVAEGILDFIRWLGDRDTKKEDEKQEGEAGSDESAQEVSTEQEIDIVKAEQTSRSFEVPSGTPVGGVSLYLPQSIVYGDNANYNEANLGIIGGAAEALVGSPASDGTTGGLRSSGIGQMATRLATQATAAGTLAALGSNIGQRLGGSRLIGAGAGAVLGGSAVADTASSISRATTNPNIRTLFQNVNVRDFRFAFRLVAQSPDEAQEIKNIIKFFRGQLYPETIRLAGVPFGYIFPNIFNIRLYYGVEEIATKILPSYLTSVQTTYNPSGAGMHADGNFVDVDIQLAFKECTTLDKERIGQGY